ncbi:MAG: hypothetical protein ACTSYR_04675 [Candidatus Odinarchaeia archaeon]
MVIFKLGVPLESDITLIFQVILLILLAIGVFFVKKKHFLDHGKIMVVVL